MTESWPFSQACENNKAPILEVLRAVFIEPATVLEVGTGTGQHAVHFAGALPHLTWQPSDRPEAEGHSRERLAHARLPNLKPWRALDVGADPWPDIAIDGAFSANTAHIMAWPEVERLFEGLSRRLPQGGAFCLYGPFNEHGRFTSDSNRRFDAFLKQQAPHMGIRDRADLVTLAGRVGMTLDAEHPMPANNQILVWRRQGND